MLTNISLYLKMPLLRSLANTLEYTFVNIRGIVHIKFSIDVQFSKNRFFSKNQTERIEFYDILTSDHISLHSQYDVLNPNIKYIDFYYDLNNETGDYIKISVLREEFLIKFKGYYIKFLKKHTDIIKKYTKKFDSIAGKHLKTIESSPKIMKIMRKWISCTLCYLTNNKGELKEFRDDVDGFFEKLDLHQDDKLQNPKVLLREMNHVFSKFPRYSKQFTVWRGMNVPMNLKTGNIIKNPMPFSTSLLPYTARSFLGNVCCMLEITIPENFPVIFLHKFRFWEKEVIISSCEFEITSTEQIKREDLTKYLGDPSIPWIQQFKRGERVLTEYIVIAKCKIVKN